MVFFSKRKKHSDLHNQLIREGEELQEKIQRQDEQLEAIKKAEASYSETGDIGSLISFWEGLWSSSGLLFNGSKWTFRLPELYIQIDQYDDAIRILNKIKNPSYAEKKNSLKEKALKAKATK